MLSFLSVLPRLARNRAAILFLAAALAGCSASYVVPPEPANVDDVRAQNPAALPDAARDARAYKESGDYLRILTAVDADAEAYVAQRAAAAGPSAKLALVLDIDETSLSNWTEIDHNDFAPFADTATCTLKPGEICGWSGWVALRKATAIEPTRDLFNAAKADHVAVFFITGRHESQRRDTIANLRKQDYAGWDALFMEPDGMHFTSAANFKAPVRAMIEAWGYTIIANVGDQPSDLDGGHAEQPFLLPDPFYRVK